MEVVWCNPLWPGSWLITFGNDAILVTKCCSLLLADWTISNGCSQVGFGECKFILMSPCVTSISATVATLFMSPLDNDRGSWGERLTGLHRENPLTHLIIIIFFLWGHLLVSINLGHVSFTSFACSEGTIHVTLFQISLAPVFQSYSF